MIDNIFCNLLADDAFKYDVVEKVFNDWKASRKDASIVNRQNADRVLNEYFDEFEWVIDDFLIDEFGEDDDDQ